MELQTIRPNIVQAIRAYRVDDLMKAAGTPASISCTPTCPARSPSRKCWRRSPQAFTFPVHFGKNLDALYDCMTDLVHKAGQQPGFVVVLEQIARQPALRPRGARAVAGGLPRRRRLLGGTTNTVQVFLFFSVARSQEIGSWERATEMAQANTVKAVKVVPKNGTNPNFGMNMPMMSSAFDTAAWLNAA